MSQVRMRASCRLLRNPPCCHGDDLTHASASSTTDRESQRRVGRKRGRAMPARRVAQRHGDFGDVRIRRVASEHPRVAHLTRPAARRQLRSCHSRLPLQTQDCAQAVDRRSRRRTTTAAPKRQTCAPMGSGSSLRARERQERQRRARKISKDQQATSTATSSSLLCCGSLDDPMY